MTRLKFKKIILPDKKTAYIPEDIELKFPNDAPIPTDQVHYLAYIPWNVRYLAPSIPKEYADFFKFIQPHLGVRTTDVHTAKCLPLLAELLKKTPSNIDQQVVYIALILHDSGWSKLTEQQIADSLSYTGLTLSQTSLGPKKDHAELGVEIAKDVLNSYQFNPALSEEQKKFIEYIVLHHDIPKHLMKQNKVPLELYLVCDADRFWSYTHENFWQDTVRKGVAPAMYWNNLNDELEGYFYTKPGKVIAKRLLADRKREVSQLIVSTS